MVLGRAAPLPPPEVLGQRIAARQCGFGQAMVARLLKACLDRGIEPVLGVETHRLVRDGERIGGIEGTKDGLPFALAARRGVIVATGAPPELARAILAFVGHDDLPVIGTQVGPKYGAIGAVRHCHHRMKMRMLDAAGYGGPVEAAYSESSADLPLLQAARRPVVVNPKASRIAMFRRVLPPGTPILNWGCPGRGGDPVA